MRSALRGVSRRSDPVVASARRPRRLLAGWLVPAAPLSRPSLAVVLGPRRLRCTPELHQARTLLKYKMNGAGRARTPTGCPQSPGAARGRSVSPGVWGDGLTTSSRRSSPRVFTDSPRGGRWACPFRDLAQTIPDILAALGRRPAAVQRAVLLSDPEASRQLLPQVSPPRAPKCSCTKGTSERWTRRRRRRRRRRCSVVHMGLIPTVQWLAVVAAELSLPDPRCEFQGVQGPGSARCMSDGHQVLGMAK